MSNIVDKIEEYLNRFMVFANPNHSKVIALWILHTHTFADAFPMGPMTTPYLYINSLEPGSGKTLLMDLCEPIVRSAERTVDMSASTLFRLIEAVRPTMLIDEVDALFSGAKNEPFRGVLNGGYKHSGYVWRVEQGEPTKFRTFGAKMLAGLDNGQLPDTVATRSIEIVLEKVAHLDDETGELIAPDGSRREIYYTFMAEEIADQLNREIAAFMADWAARYTRYMPKAIKGLSPRQFEIAFPLLQVAHAVGIEDEAREAIIRTFKDKPVRESESEKALRLVKELFDATGAEALHTDQIMDALGEGWNGKLFSNRVVRPYSIGSPTTLNIAGRKPAKGYYRHQFEGAFANHVK